MVGDPRRAEHGQQNPAERHGDEVHELHDERVDQIDDHHAGDAPCQRKLQTDVALDVQRTVGIVPPLVVEQLFEHPAGEKLQHGREHHAAEEQNQQIVLERLQHEQHGQHAEAVDRADRPVDKAAVDEFALPDGLKRDLGTPAEEAVEEEEPQDLEPGVAHKKTPFACIG